MTARRVLIIGGGITGLTAAYRLARARDAGAPVEPLLLEAADRPGGVIRTERADGCLFEHGPDTFLSSKPEAVALCRELGLGDSIIGTNPESRRSFILRAGRLEPVPEGFYLMAPGSVWALARTRLFSWPGKLRMAMEPLIPARKSTGDESLADFVRRRLGTEALERIAQPMIAGIYSADPETLSLAATMPQFLEWERKYGSVIRGLAARQREQAAEASASGPRYGLFVTPAGGVQALVDALAAKLPPGAVRLNAAVRAVRRSERGWTVELAAGDGLSAEAVCVCVPAPAAGKLLAESAPAVAAELSAIEYAPCVVLNFVFRREQIGHALDGAGFVVPAVERRFLIAGSFSSVKYAGRAPADRVVIRAFVGGALHAADTRLADDDLRRRALDDLRSVLSIAGEPESVRIASHPDSMAQYHVGHLERVSRIEQAAAAVPGLYLAGNAYRGVGIPDCIRSATQAARRIVEAPAP
jgi:oxygen-dependent protoporphyrinogen oxidase